MSKNTLGFIAATLSLGLGFGLSSTGCGGASVSDICDLICTCEPCTDADRKECEEDGNKSRDAAESAGCGDAFDDMLSCFKDNASCQDDSAVGKACSAQLAAFNTCNEGGGGGNPDNPCTKASAHISVCLDSSSGGSGDAICEGVSLCAAQCINAADCAVIKDAFSGQPTEVSKAFLDCSAVCGMGS